MSLSIDAYIDRIPITNEGPCLLPLCHTTSHNTMFNDIAPTRQLVGKQCPYNNNEKLVFLFYGLAKFENDLELNAKYRIDDRPVTLLYSYHAFHINARRLVTFDSGGIELYGEALNMQLNVADHQILAPKRESFQKLVKSLYKSNKNYAVSKVAAEPSSLETCPPLKIIHTLHKKYKDGNEKVRYDQRAFLFEIQYLDEGRIYATPDCLFVPSEKKRCTEFEAYMKERLGAQLQVIGYNDTVYDSLRKCYDKMQRKVGAYLRTHFLEPNVSHGA